MKPMKKPTLHIGTPSLPAGLKVTHNIEGRRAGIYLQTGYSLVDIPLLYIEHIPTLNEYISGMRELYHNA